MARSYEEFHEQNKHKLKEEFSAKHNAEPNENETKKMQENINLDNHIEQRIQAKMLDIMEERSAPQPTPSFAAGQDLSLDSIHREAIQRVLSETIQEKKEWTKNMVENTENKNAVETSQKNQNTVEPPTQLETKNNQASEQMQEPQVQNKVEELKPDKTFKAQMHQIVDESQKLRSEASRTFIKNRTELLPEAEALGSDNPALDVSKAQREVHKTINANEHKHLHALFQENGWDYEKQGVEFVESETNTYSNTQENSQEQVIQQAYTQGEEQ